MQRKIKLFMFIILLMASAMAQNTKEIYLQIDLPAPVELSTLTSMVSISAIKGNVLLAYATPAQAAKLELAEIHYVRLTHPHDNYSARMAHDLEQLREWDYYPTYPQYLDMMYRFGENFPDICRVENIGTTVEGRELLFVKISDNVGSEEDEPEFMYSSTMHGNEIVGYALMLHLIDHLLSNYGTDPQITNLVNSAELWINPLANPDGTYTGGDDTVSGAVRFNANGVDLNRNFPDFMDGEHPDGNAWQPENIAMMEFFSEHSFVLSSNLHSGAEVVNYPWDTTPDLTADDDWWQQVSHAYADTVQSHSPGSYFGGFDDGITNGNLWYEIDGGRQDYLNYYRHCREMTLELSDEQMLPAENLPDFWDYNRASFLNYMSACLFGIRGIVTNTAGEPLAASITITEHDFDNSYVITDPDVGDYHRLLAPGSYDLVVSAFGFASQSFDNLSVTPNATVIQNAVLVELPQTTLAGAISDGITGAPLAGAQVTLAGTPFEAAYSGPSGDFEIADVFEGAYILHVFLDGYAALLDSVTVTAGMDPLELVLAPSDLISFEGGLLPEGWQTSGDSPWSITLETASDGLYSARSGDIDDDENSVLTITTEAATDDMISFFSRVSCEDDTNNNWDYLKFEIDGTEINRWDGQVPWHSETYPVAAGLHTFTWTYHKDGSVSHFEDAGWIDGIMLPAVLDLSDLQPGDVNLDTIVDVMDLVVLVNFILNVDVPTPQQFVAGDVDENGLLNVLDLITIINLILSN